jgi:hypothetical protein
MKLSCSMLIVLCISFRLYFRVLLHSICLGCCMFGLHGTLLSERLGLGRPAVVFVMPWPRGSDLCYFDFPGLAKMLPARL